MPIVTELIWTRDTARILEIEQLWYQPFEEILFAVGSYPSQVPVPGINQIDNHGPIIAVY